MRLRWMAQELGFEKVVIKNQKMVAWLVYQQDSDYYASAIFGKIMNYLQTHPNAASIKENNQKLSISFDHIKNVQQALGNIEKINGWVNPN
jgi:transcription-repair coupling factor (superfamily II helicase)